MFEIVLGFMVFNATFQQYFSNIVVVSLPGVGNLSTRRNNRTPAGHLQTLSHNVVLSMPCLRGIRTHNVSGDMN